MEDQAEGIARIVREDDELQARMDADAKATAHGLIQGYLGPDHKVRICRASILRLCKREGGTTKGQSDSFEFR